MQQPSSDGPGCDARTEVCSGLPLTRSPVTAQSSPFPFIMSAAPTIIYTKTDEAPALATYSLLPIIQAFTRHAGIAVETRDISLAGRILAQFSDRLGENQ